MVLENLTQPRDFNLMFKCGFGPIKEDKNFVYLRPETAQSIFINFKNIINTSPKKLPLESLRLVNHLEMKLQQEISF